VASLLCGSGLRLRECATLRVKDLGFERLEMALFAATARRRRGEIIGGEEGRSLVRASVACMIEQRIRNPERMAGMLAPV